MITADLKPGVLPAEELDVKCEPGTSCPERGEELGILQIIDQLEDATEALLRRYLHCIELKNIRDKWSWGASRIKH